MADVFAGGWRKGDRVASLVEYRDKWREIGKGDIGVIHPRSDDPMLSSNLNEAWENRQFLLLSNCKDVVTCATEVRRIAREHQQVPTEARRLPTLNQDIEAVLFHLNKSPFNSSPLPSGYTILQFFQRKLLKDKTAGRPPIGPSGRWADLTAFSTAVAVEVVITLFSSYSLITLFAYHAIRLSRYSQLRLPLFLSQSHGHQPLDVHTSESAVPCTHPILRTSPCALPSFHYPPAQFGGGECVLMVE
jgi:hypothetical protein